MKFSFLIPVFNKESYLDNCFNSILNQKYKNYEVIIIDDCSTDNSVSVIDKYIEKYDNFKLYKNSCNKGLPYNRNRLVEKSTGDYLIFLDADDYVSDNLLEDLLPYTQDNVDLIKVNINHVNRPAKDDKDKYNFYPGKEILNSNDAIKVFLSVFEKHYAISGSYIIKKELITKNNIKYPENIRVHEDVATTPILISFSKKIAFVNKVGYYYVENVKSLSNSFYKNEEWKLEEHSDKNEAFQSAVLYAIGHLTKSPNISIESKKLLISDLLKRAKIDKTDEYLNNI